MKHATLVVLLAVLVGVPAHLAVAQDAGSLPDQLVRVLERINSGRHAAGLPPLARDPGLDAAAQAHSDDMASHDMLEHVSPRTGDPAARVLAAGVHAQTLAENIAVEPSALAAHDRLVVSDEHRANMLGRTLTAVGLGATHGARGVYLTELFADLRAPVAAAPPPAPMPTPVVMGAPLPPPTPVAAQPPPMQVATQLPVGAQPPQYVAGAAPAPGTALAVQGGQVDGRRVVGYWVSSQGRWFYYPLPAGAQPGQVLAAAPMPPGVGPETYSAPVPAPAPYAYSGQYMAAPPGGIYVMPRAHAHWRRW